MTESGSVYATGLNDFGQLGISDDRIYTTVCCLYLISMFPFFVFSDLVVYCDLILDSSNCTDFLDLLWTMSFSENVAFIIILFFIIYKIAISRKWLPYKVFLLVNVNLVVLLSQEPLEVSGLPKEIVKVSAGYSHSSAITGLK